MENLRANTVEAPDTLQQTDDQEESEKDERDLLPDYQGAEDSGDCHCKKSSVKEDADVKEDPWSPLRQPEDPKPLHQEAEKQRLKTLLSLP
ncbi:hypothetical protein FOCG_09775 [Fusarium oxysporum f. sp. radicis-lycopersici 26381]|nr:hypothetical protein FOWG_07354 [Fusarium oxysporum f. sp. lycopersici MN25]EXL49405.1 hypothetical protein FOCG_09775 [Fusarium oxysporum f. sp. radicis-lycopersici 26381]